MRGVCKMMSIFNILHVPLTRLRAVPTGMAWLRHGGGKAARLTCLCPPIHRRCWRRAMSVQPGVV